MKTQYLMVSAILVASMSFDASAEVVGTEAAPADQAMTPAPGTPMTPAQMVQRMQEMRQQQMERMQANRQGRPMMGPRGGMMNPEMMQRMQEMHQQRMEMMQANRQARPMMGPGAMLPAETEQNAADAPMAAQVPATSAGDGSCAQMHGQQGNRGMYMKGMKKEMMAMRQQHMQAIEQRLSNIENLMRETVELLKSR